MDENPLNCLGMNSLRVIGGRPDSMLPPHTKSRPATKRTAFCKKIVADHTVFSNIALSLQNANLRLR
jgi:hypothetical protein